MTWRATYGSLAGHNACRSSCNYRVKRGIVKKTAPYLLSSLVTLVAPSAASAELGTVCRSVVDQLVETMREPLVSETPEEARAREQQLRSAQDAINAGRRKNIDECVIWRKVSGGIAGL